MTVSFSVIVPVYNKADSLKRCIDSILNQLKDQDELIAVDDGSTDSSLSILKQYSSDPHFRLIEQTNAGVSAARNTGLLRSSGDYVLFVDADDTLQPDALNLLQKALTEQPVDLLCANAFVCREDGSRELMEMRKDESLQGEGFLNACLLDRTVTHHVWSNAYRRLFLKNNGIVFDERRQTHEDGDFNIQCGLKKPEFRIIPEGIYNHFKNKNGISQSKVTDRKIQDMLAVAAKTKKAVEEQFPDLSDLAENAAVKSHMAVLAICPPKDTAAQCIQYVKDHAQYFVANSNTDRILFFLICHHLYGIYRLAYRIKFPQNR